MLFLLSSCGWFTKESQEFDKTLLIYMVANNNLTSYAVSNLSDIKKGYVPDYEGKKKGSALLVYYHVTNANPVLLRIFKDENGAVREERVVEYEAQNSASPEVLNAVLDKVATLFPAKENGLIMWSHATGWLPEGFYSNPVALKGNMLQMMAVEEDPYAHLVKSFGEDSGEEMDVIDMAAAMPIKYNYVIFDCCLMGGIEVAYQMKDVCDYIIASPTEVMAAGFPYGQIVEPLLKGYTADLQKCSERYFDYYNAQSGNYKSATVALMKTSELESLASSFKALFDAGGREAIAELNMNTIQPYYRMNRHWFYDLENYAKDLSEILEREDLYLRIKADLSKVVLYKDATDYFISIKIDPEKYSGVSTFIPNPQNSYLEEYYKKFEWNRACGMIE